MATNFCSTHNFYYVTQKNTISYPSHKIIQVPFCYTQKLSQNVICCSLTTDIPYQQNERKSGNYQPTIWSYNFIQSLNVVDTDVSYKEKVKKLEDKVRNIMNSEDNELLTVLEMIDDIQRLGLSHRFQKDIKKILDEVWFIEENNRNAKKSLHESALSFRLLRQHGYKISQDVFKQIMNQKGDLKTSHKLDSKGLSSLYEAAHLSFEEEELLNNALTQSTLHLKNILKDPQTNIWTMERISHALELPLHKRMVMLEARWYIEAYSKTENVNLFLLELAKLDFDTAQSVLQRDLKDMSRWWNNLGLSKILSFSRDRLMECFFWTVGMVFEPQLITCRKGLTKVASFITTIDDVYDVYGTLDELELFTSAVERWDVNAVKDLPDYMKLCYLAFFNSINEIAYECLKHHGEDVIPYLKTAWTDLFKAFLQEAKWSHKKIIPSFDEYLENAWRSVSGTVILIHAYFLMGQTNSKEALNSLANYHEVLKWSSIIFRQTNDLGTSSAEIVRGEAVNSISCYMNEKGVSQEQARKHINKLIDKAWKKINVQFQHGETPFEKQFLEVALNLARISQCTYLMETVMELLMLMQRRESNH